MPTPPPWPSPQGGRERSEARLWSRLRCRQLDNFRFRRQQPMGPYIVDFFCPEARLIVEVDGGQHAEAQGYDQARTRWLEARGHRMLRFWNNDVLGNLEGVLLVIRDAFRERYGLPFPLAGEGQGGG